MQVILKSELRPAKIRENTHYYLDIIILCPYIMCVLSVNKHDKKAHSKNGDCLFVATLI